MEIKDVVIIGAGPAGLAAATQLRRYGIEPVLLEKKEIGGLLRNANLVENYPGFPEGISGVELVKFFKKQIENAGIKVFFEEVLELDYKNETFFVSTNKRTMTFCYAIVASGTKPRRLSLLETSTDSEDHIFYEVLSLAQAANEKIAIIGAGDAAFDYALNLSKKNQVTILNRTNRTKCLPLLMDRAMRSEKISYLENIQVEKIKSDNDGMTLICSKAEGKYELHVDYLVVAIGREPCLDFLSENLQTNLERPKDLKLLYMIGDVNNDIYRQTAISVGDGIKAAMEIYRKMKRPSPISSPRGGGGRERPDNRERL